MTPVPVQLERRPPAPAGVFPTRAGRMLAAGLALCSAWATMVAQVDPHAGHGHAAQGQRERLPDIDRRAPAAASSAGARSFVDDAAAAALTRSVPGARVDRD